VPENLQNAKILTGYAVETRYPGDYEPVAKIEHYYLGAQDILRAEDLA